MQTLNFDNQVIWFDESLISAEQVKYAFDAEYWQQQNRIIGSAKGRGTTWFIQLDSIQAALRHYRRGGFFGKFVKDSYLYFGERKTRSHQELELLRELKVAKVNVPRPIAARFIKKNFFYSADLLTEKVSNARDLVSILQETELSEDIYHDIGLEIARMHKAGVNHTDLNINNILLDDEKSVWIIDFDKCKKCHDGVWKESNLSRLRRSFLKECKRKELFWDESHFQSILEGYNSNELEEI